MFKAKSNDELVFLPLGGSNEIGMNFNLYGYGPPHDRKWVVVDLGVTFGDQTTPGVEVILPDPEWKQRTRGESWYPGDTANMAIGQGDVLLSPLQMACFAASPGPRPSARSARSSSSRVSRWSRASSCARAARPSSC